MVTSKYEYYHCGVLASIVTSLVVVLKVGPIVPRYIHVEIAFVPCKVARHHINQLIVGFLEQLAQFAMDKTFSSLPKDVSLIG